MKLAHTMAAMLLLGSGAAGAVDINQADADTLARELDGVGAAKAVAIVEYRETHGPFRSLEALVEVKGIGQRILEINRDRISLSNDQP